MGTDLPRRLMEATAAGDAWEVWLTAWEDHLGVLLAWSGNPAGVPPEPPTVPQPAGAAPAGLRVRLRRCEALRTQIEGVLGAALETTRRWTPAPAAPARPRVNLDL